MFLLSELKWAFAMITKYSFPITRHQWFDLHGYKKEKWRRKVPGIGDDPSIDWSENINGFAFIPFLDLIKYESIPYKRKYNVSRIFQVDSEDVEQQLKNYGIKDPKKDVLELTGADFEQSPFFDYLYFHNPSINDISSMMRHKTSKFTLLSNKNYKKGEEIRYLLSRYSNNDILLNQG